MMTWAPRSFSSRAMPRPMPRAAPVTIATCPSSSVFIGMSLTVRSSALGRAPGSDRGAPGIRPHAAKTGSTGVLYPLQDVRADSDQRSVLVGDPDVAARTAPVGIDCADEIIDGDRVAEKDRRKEPDAIVAEGVRGLVRILARLRNRHRRYGRHVADHQRTVRLQPAIARLLHVRLVDMVRREVTGDAGETVDVVLTDRFREFGVVADLDVQFGHPLPPAFCFESAIAPATPACVFRRTLSGLPLRLHSPACARPPDSGRARPTRDRAVTGSAA